MRTSHRWREVCAGAFLLVTLLLRPDVAHAALQVASDEACGLHEIDIAAFATCEDGLVTLPLDAGERDADLPADDDWRD